MRYNVVVKTTSRMLLKEQVVLNL